MGPLLDHIVILVPHQVLVDLPAWIATELTIIPGGKHADGLTENKLIVFEDGVYLELIAFVRDADPERRHEHGWGQKPEGTIVDWAYTLAIESDFGDIQKRVKEAASGIRYADPVSGGRIKDDGTEVKWAVATAVTDYDAPSPVPMRRGEMPFWCFDRTSRNIRVPHDVGSNTRHACGATGIASVTISLSESEKYTAANHAYQAVHNKEDASTAYSTAESRGSLWKVYPPAAARGKDITIQLALSPTPDDLNTEPLIQITLFATKSNNDGRMARTLSGRLGGSLIEIKLVDVS